MEEAFLEAIAQTPDDDTPRLVYADWLDDHGAGDAPARAALIRAQCALESLPPADPRRPALKAEAARLLKAHGKAWTADLRKAKLVSGWAFRRGFLDWVQMKAPRFAADGDKVFRLVPMLRAVRFPDASNEVRQLARSPHLARLAEVDLGRMCSCGHCPIQGELRDLFASPHAANLATLDLSGDRLDLPTLRALGESPHLGRLVSLDISDNRLGQAGGQLAEVLPATLRVLAVRNARLDAGAARALAGWVGLAGVAVLDLRQNALATAGAKALAGSPHLGRLGRLLVGDNKIGPVGEKALRGRFGDRVEL